MVAGDNVAKQTKKYSKINMKRATPAGGKAPPRPAAPKQKLKSQNPAALRKAGPSAGRSTPAKASRPQGAAASLATGASAGDDVVAIALSLPEPKLNASMSAYFKKCMEKLGFVPNVLKAYAFDMAKLEAFVAFYNDLMLGPSGLSKLEREMIAVAVSSQNRCYYCLVAHGAAVRQLSSDPVLGELLVMNYRSARLSKRQRTMLDFAVKLTSQPWAVEENDRERLRRGGFSDPEIWDIAAVAGFFNMSNRVASATDMRPNTAYHRQSR